VIQKKSRESLRGFLPLESSGQNLGDHVDFVIDFPVYAPIVTEIRLDDLGQFHRGLVFDGVAIRVAAIVLIVGPLGGDFLKRLQAVRALAYLLQFLVAETLDLG